MRLAKINLILGLAFSFLSCHKDPASWNGPGLNTVRDQLTVEQLLTDSVPELIDLSYFAKPGWADDSTFDFSGSISFADTEILFPVDRDHYPGETIFPGLTVDFITHEGNLIPLQQELIITRSQSTSFWDVIVGTGKVWHEVGDGEWSRASFPLTLTDRYVGQARNCVATFVYKPNHISNICVQCSQETADLNAKQIGNLRTKLAAKWEPKTYTNAASVIERHKAYEQQRLPVYPLSSIDSSKEVADIFEQTLATNAPTSIGAIIMDGKIFLHPPKTRHGLYPYPAEMRHGVYSVTKSMAGALSLLYFTERYGEQIFDALITDYVPALKNHPGWKEVTFSNTLNMVTGTVGSESSEHLYEVLILARTAEEAITNISKLGDAPELPGEKFNYASTNLFVLSYALQNYVQKREGKEINYWDLVRENVLVPIHAEHFTVQRTVEIDGSKGIPRLAYGALPTADEAAKISLLFANAGSYNGQQLLHKEKTQEALGRLNGPGYQTDSDFRGTTYRHSFWSKKIKTSDCSVEVTYMLGYGENYVLFLPSDVIVLRFLDESDLDFSALVKSVEKIRSSCK